MRSPATSSRTLSSRTTPSRSSDEVRRPPLPGSNCDQDCIHALSTFPGTEADYVWHKDTSLGGADAVVVPGGFSYGDYLRTGSIARFSPIMKTVKELPRRRAGHRHLQGFQILCESGLLPAPWCATATCTSSANMCFSAWSRRIRPLPTPRPRERCSTCRWLMAKAATLPTTRRSSASTPRAACSCATATRRVRSRPRRTPTAPRKTSRASAMKAAMSSDSCPTPSAPATRSSAARMEA